MDTNVLVNPSGILIKPMNRAHMMKLLQSESKWITGPDGEPKQVGGFRRPSPEELAAHESAAREQSLKMERNELETKKRNASIVMMAPDEGTLDRMIEAREARAAEKRAASKSKE